MLRLKAIFKKFFWRDSVFVNGLTGTGKSQATEGQHTHYPVTLSTANVATFHLCNQGINTIKGSILLFFALFPLTFTVNRFTDPIADCS
ncbi:hypothetical protein C8N47_10576 [Mangrovibacterium marinum]|uniref:Uncharacterized protein n=1 Tax=Mangrovibacterium marinum TaxID=1639118 RepID=A0A2T5C3B5_9BACT|nr:hypothetical protein C8N47_10576 [Mangrovibacterium marinum]